MWQSLSFIYDFSGSMVGHGKMEFILYCGEKFLCDGTFYIVVGAALCVNVCDFLEKPSLAGPDVPDTLQLIFKIVTAYFPFFSSPVNMVLFFYFTPVDRKVGNI